MIISLWDDPFGEEVNRDNLQICIAGQSSSVNLEIIRERQKKLLPYIDELRRAAREIISRYDPLTLITSEREIFTVVEYRLPDSPNLLQRFSHFITDYAVVIPFDRGKDHPIINKFSPPILASKIKGQGNISALLKLESIEREIVPEKVRIVYPSLLGFISFWVREIEGPINNFYYQERSANTNYRNFSLSNLKH